jgi:hypothetical protein
MGGGGGSKSSSSSGSAQAWAMPLAKSGASSVQSVFDRNQPGLQNMTGMVQNDLNPALMAKFKGGLPVAQQGTQFNSDVLSGKYLNGNPHLQQMIDLSAGDIRENVNARISQAGRYASGAHDGVMADSIGQMSAGMRYQNYGDEMSRMGQAAQAAQAGTQGDNAQLLASLGLGAELPYTGSNNLANSLGALFNGGTEKSKTSGPGIMDGLMGMAGSLGAAAITKCDVRLKENVTLNHVAPDGLAFYDFTYKPGLGLPEGVQANLPMAQDVAVLRPWALGPEEDGFMTIYPGKL